MCFRCTLRVAINHVLFHYFADAVGISLFLFLICKVRLIIITIVFINFILHNEIDRNIPIFGELYPRYDIIACGCYRGVVGVPFSDLRRAWYLLIKQLTFLTCVPCLELWPKFMHVSCTIKEESKKLLLFFSLPTH